jgi:WD40 repeat protein
VLAGHTQSVLCLAAQGDLLASGSADGTVRIWKVTITAGMGRCSFACECVATLTQGAPVTGVKLWSSSADGKVSVFACDTDGQARVWDLSTGACVSTIEAHDAGAGQSRVAEFVVCRSDM